MLQRFCDLPRSLSFVLSMGLLHGCQSIDEPAPEAPYAELPICASSSWCDDVSHLRPASAVDYIELRSPLGNGTSPSGCVIAAAGTKCSGATDAASCRRAVASFTPNWYLFGPGLYSLITTVVDRVQTAAEDQTKLAAFLVPIDSEWEATLVVRAASYGVDCAAPMNQVVRSVPGGYEVIASTGTGCGPGQDVYRHTLLVSADGTITDQSKELIRKTDPNCIFE